MAAHGNILVPPHETHTNLSCGDLGYAMHVFPDGGPSPFFLPMRVYGFVKEPMDLAKILAACEWDSECASSLLLFGFTQHVDNPCGKERKSKEEEEEENVG